MIEALILAIALSMDAFAVSIGLGSRHLKQTKSLAILAALYFGLFQALMPLVGFLAGKGLLVWVEEYADWIAFALLLFVGGKMVYESLTEGIEKDIARITHQLLLMLAIATSVDAMAAGFTLTLLAINPVIACAIIGLTTLLMSWLGVYVGARSGTWLESKSELLGGIVLIIIGFNFLLF